MAITPGTVVIDLNDCDEIRRKLIALAEMLDLMTGLAKNVVSIDCPNSEGSLTQLKGTLSDIKFIVDRHAYGASYIL